MFIFNNISSDDMGIICESLPPIEIPSREIENISVDGKDGSYTVLKDYPSTVKRVVAHYVGNNFDELALWLNGNGNIIFSNLEDRYYKATVNNSIPLTEIISNKLNKFVINFKCQPFGYIRNNEEIKITSNNYNLYNYGTMFSTPKIRVIGNGDITLNISNGVDRQTILLKNIEGYIDIDSEFKICTKETTNISSKITGDYPILKTGENNISYVGSVSGIYVTPNFRHLI